MDVIDMAVKIFLVPHHVFPESTLPYAPLPAFLSAFGNSLASIDSTREMTF